MKLETIVEEWQNDLPFSGNISADIRNLPSLHNKYYMMVLTEKSRLHVFKQEHSTLYNNTRRYFAGELCKEEIEELGFPHEFPIKLPKGKTIMRTDIDGYIKADKRFQNLETKVFLQEEKVNLLNVILKDIKDRNYMLQNIVKYEVFKAGN